MQRILSQSFIKLYQGAILFQVQCLKLDLRLMPDVGYHVFGYPCYQQVAGSEPLITNATT